MNDLILQRRARRAYELSRLRRGLGWAVLVVPLAALSHTCCLAPIALWCVCGAAFLAVLFGVWRGQALGAGARAGVLAGFASWIAPVMARWGGLGFSRTALVLCLAGGIASGLIVGWQLRGRRESASRFLLGASVVAGLIGALGCIVAGAAGVVGMLLGELLGAVPLVVIALRPARPVN